MFTYKIPAELNGGEYTIEVFDWRLPLVKRKFRVNQNTLPELFVTLDFDKKNYAPESNVVAKVKVRKPDGTKLPNGTAIMYHASNDWGVFASSSGKITLDNRGEATIRF